MEVEELGYMLSAHPMDFVDLPDHVIRGIDIRNYAGKRVKMAGLAISAKLIATRTDGKAMRLQFNKVVNRDLLFDVGAEAINLVVPGGAIALKVVQHMTRNK